MISGQLLPFFDFSMKKFVYHKKLSKVCGFLRKSTFLPIAIYSFNSLGSWTKQPEKLNAPYIPDKHKWKIPEQHTLWFCLSAYNMRCLQTTLSHPAKENQGV